MWDTVNRYSKDSQYLSRSYDRGELKSHSSDVQRFSKSGCPSIVRSRCIFNIFHWSLCRSLRESARTSGKINRQNDDLICWWLTFKYTTVQYMSKWWWFWSFSCPRLMDQVRCSRTYEKSTIVVNSHDWNDMSDLLQEEWDESTCIMKFRNEDNHV